MYREREKVLMTVTMFSCEIPRVKKLAYLQAPRFGDTTDYPIQGMERQLAAQGLAPYRSQLY